MMTPRSDNAPPPKTININKKQNLIKNTGLHRKWLALKNYLCNSPLKKAIRKIEQILFFKRQSLVFVIIQTSALVSTYAMTSGPDTGVSIYSLCCVNSTLWQSFITPTQFQGLQIKPTK